MKKSKLPEIYYQAASGAYWVRLPTGLYIEQDKADVKLRLRQAGLNDERTDEGLNACERELLRIQDTQFVHYAGPLSGRRVGRYDFDGFRVLVTQEPTGVWDKQPKAKADACPKIERYLGQLLGDQAPYFLAWCKVRVESLEACEWRPGPVVVFVGPSSCGKSFVHWLISRLLGGREAKPMRYLTGLTQFNQDLAESEHWFIEDERADTSYAARRDFGNALKQVAVNETLSVHGKGLKAVLLPVWKCCSMSLNPDPEDIAILPPFTPAVLNKLMCFDCGVAELSEDRKKNRDEFGAEIPAFRAWLKAWKIPAALRQRPDEFRRYGHDCWHHPKIVADIHGMSPEESLLGMIDEHVLANAELVSMKASEITAALRKVDPATVAKLLPHENTCGKYLARLAERYPKRVASYRSDGHVKWKVSRG